MDWKTKTLLFYMGCGLVLGAVAGIMTINNAVENDREAAPTLKDGARICFNGLKNMKNILIK